MSTAIKHTNFTLYLEKQPFQRGPPAQLGEFVAPIHHPFVALPTNTSARAIRTTGDRLDSDERILLGPQTSHLQVDAAGARRQVFHRSESLDIEAEVDSNSEE